MTEATPILTAESAAAASHVVPKVGQLARSTVIVMVAFGIAKVISLVQTVIIADVFGVGREWDAFVTANSVPELIFTLIAGGALANAFIPVFSGYIAREDRTGAWRTASHVINTVFLLTLIVSSLAFIFAPILVSSLIAPGFTPDAQAETFILMRILLISTLIFSISGIMMGILQSHNRFLLPALAPIMFDAGILFGVIFLTRQFGVYGIAYGAVIGAALHLAIQLPGLLTIKAKWFPQLGLRDPELWRIIRLMLPLVAGLFLFSFSFIVMNSIASRLGEGAVSALSWGWRLMQIPETLIGTAMGTVILPTLAAFSALGDVKGKRDAMSNSIRFILITTIPSAVGLIVVGRPLISLLEGGAFDASATALVFSTLQFFTLGLVTQSVVEVAARSFYADKDTMLPLWASLANAILNISLAFVLSGVAQVEARGFYNQIALQFPSLGLRPDFGNVGGLALAQSIGFTVEMLILLFVLRRRWRGLNENTLIMTTIKSVIASIVMAVLILIVDSVLNALDLFGRGRVFTGVLLGIEVFVGLVGFIGAAAVLKMEELRLLRSLIKKSRNKDAP